MTVAMYQNGMMCAHASANSAEASSCCFSAYNCMGIVLGAIVMASIFVSIISVLSLRLLAVSIIILVGLVHIIMNKDKASPIGENS